MEAEVLNNIIGIEKKENNLVFKLNNASFLKKYSSLDISILVYPLTKAHNSNNFRFLPYEEYVEDASDNKKTIYRKLASNYDKLFGTILGLIVLAINFIATPTDLLSIRSAVTTVSAYALGKEIWEYIETFMVNISERWFISFKEAPYTYTLRKPSTITKYSYLAKKIRYGEENILANKLDFVQQSNSKNIKLEFTHNQIKDFSNVNQILIMDPDSSTIEMNDLLIAIKVSLNKKILFINSSEEYFQGFKGEDYGSLDDSNHWFGGTSFFRSSLNFARFKVYLSSKIVKNIKLLKF